MRFSGRTWVARRKQNRLGSHVGRTQGSTWVAPLSTLINRDISSLDDSINADNHEVNG